MRELWVYDPTLVGPRARGGPHPFQLWQRRDDGGFERTSAGASAVYSPSLAAWLHPQASSLPSGARLFISDDRDGSERWLSSEQQARCAEQQARASEREARELLERERAARVELEARLRQLEARARG